MGHSDFGNFSGHKNYIGVFRQRIILEIPDRYYLSIVQMKIEAIRKKINQPIPTAADVVHMNPAMSCCGQYGGPHWRKALTDGPEPLITLGKPPRPPSASW